jgi:hypothetical protein
MLTNHHPNRRAYFYMSHAQHLAQVKIQENITKQKYDSSLFYSNHLRSPINTRVGIYTHANLTSIMVLLALLLLFSCKEISKLMRFALIKE